MSRLRAVRERVGAALRRWSRFSVRTLLVLVLLVGTPLGVLSTRLYALRQQQAVAAWVLGRGGVVVYDYQLDDSNQLDASAEPATAKWMQKLLGEDIGSDVLVVSLHGCEVGDADLERFGRLTRLVSLDLGCTPVGNAGLRHLDGLERLESLDLHGTKVGDAGLRSLAGLRRLEVLDLSGTRVTDQGLGTLRSLEKLSELRIARTAVTGLTLARLPASLNYLDLADDEIRDSDLARLQRFKQLGGVNLHLTRVTDGGTNWLRQRMPELVVFGHKSWERTELYRKRVYLRLSVCRESNVYRPAGARHKWKQLVQQARELWGMPVRRILQTVGGGGMMPLFDDVSEGGTPAWQRLVIRLDDQDLQRYAMQLDFLQIELGAAAGGRPGIEYARDFSIGKALRRRGSPGDEHRLYVESEATGSADFDRRLLQRAGIDTQGRELLKFISDELANELAARERDALLVAKFGTKYRRAKAYWESPTTPEGFDESEFIDLVTQCNEYYRSQMAKVHRTVFALRPSATGFRLVVDEVVDEAGKPLTNTDGH